MSDKKHYEAIKDVHVNLDNRNHAIDEYGYGPLNPKGKNDDFWNEKSKLWKTPVEEAKKSRCYNCAAFNQTPQILKDMGDAIGPVGDKIVEKANLGFCEFFYFKCAGDRTCDAWIVNGPLKEGIADKIGAFGRGFADKATGGGYKYARAAVDYGAKRTLNALGLKGGEKTTYGRELDQEKEKLKIDSEKEPLASAAGDVAGHAIPYAPVIGGAVQAVKGAIGAAQDYASKVTPVADKLSRGLQEKNYMTIDEDAPANATGSAVPGTGDDPQAFPKGEPLKRYKKKTEKEQNAVSDNISLLRRATPNMIKEESEKTGDYKTGMFAGSTTFVVPSNIFHEAKLQKRRGKHWRTYIGEEDHWRHIREYAKKNPKKAIILQDERTGAMCYARYGKEKNLMEVELMKISKDAVLTSRLRDTLSKEEMASHNRESREITGRNRYTRIGSIGDHDIIHDQYRYTNSRDSHSYIVRHRETGKIDGEIEGDYDKHPRTFKVDVASSTGEGPKMHDVYHKILSHGASARRKRSGEHYVTSLVSGEEQSEGGMRMWQNLARKKNMSVHGWHSNKAVNLDPSDEGETHATHADIIDDPDDDMDTRKIMRTKLVASYVKRKTSKED